MGCNYAGVLGFLSFFTVVVRSLIRGGGIESTLPYAMGVMFAFAAIGYIAGQLAGWIVEESVKSQMTAEIAEQSAVKNQRTENHSA